MKKHIQRIFAFFALAMLICSCASARKIVYLQDLENGKTVGHISDFQPVIKTGDKLRINVSAPVVEVVTHYNVNGETPYTVDNDGYIAMPVLGRVAAIGLTTRQLSDRLTGMISVDVKDPVVVVSFADYRVTILGEVRAPGTYSMAHEQTNIFQAIGLAGDLTMAGKRNNILLLRETNHGYQYTRLDIRSSDILNSPYFYVHQNDVIYVEPTPSRIQSGTSSQTIMGLAVSALSLTNLIIALSNKF
jgi:polysaccharide export outer membrane protein